MAIENFAVTFIGDFIAYFANFFLRLFGMSEIKAQKITEKLIFMMFAILIISAVYITFKFS